MSNARWPRLGRLAAGLRHAFSTASPHGPLTEADRELLQRLAAAIVRRRMATPAVLFLESMKPLNYLGSQAMLFLRPFLTPLFNPAQYERLAEILENRDTIGVLIESIHGAEANG